MEKNFLIFISIVFLSIAHSYADNEGALPPLPTALEVQEEKEVKLDSNKSLWQKFKEYIGLRGEEKNTEVLPTVSLSVEKIEDQEQVTLLKSTNDDQIVTNNKEEDNKADIIPPIGSTDEGPMDIKLSKELESEAEVPDQLELLDNFGAHLVDDHNDIAAPIEPTQAVVSLDEIARKNNAIDNMSMPTISNEAKATKEVTEARAEDVSIPKLPDIDQGNVKEASTNNNVQEPIETETKAQSSATDDKLVVKLELPTDNPKDKAVASHDIAVPEYVDAKKLNKAEAAILKYKKEFEAKAGASSVVPKISESELLVKGSSKQIDLKASDLEEFDARQLQFVNNEAQVLILPNDDVVLGVLNEEAKLDQMDFRLYVDKFWENYNKLKREPKHLEIEKFIENYDELFDTNNSFDGEK